MSIDAFKHNPFSIQSHNISLHLKTPETNPVRNHFRKRTCFIVNL